MPTRVKKRESPGDDSTSQRIIAAARRYFFSHGFRGVTMDDLAEELGMSKKTLYAGFHSKSALLEAVVEEKFRTVEADFKRVVSERPADALESLHQLLACVQRHTEEIQPPFVRDIQRNAPEIFKRVERKRRELIQRYFGRIFDEGRREGIIRKDIPTKVMIEILLAATEGVVNPRKMAELGLTPKTGFNSVISIILTGALTEKHGSKP
ncbi:MAG TPA: TetR/AcrR family transcriptional regulator [Candidatus Binatia bacterium]|jgi:AcrR family transcriptional regulator